MDKLVSILKMQFEVGRTCSRLLDSSIDIAIIVFLDMRTVLLAKCRIHENDSMNSMFFIF